jgi:hypothetical protein
MPNRLSKLLACTALAAAFALAACGRGQDEGNLAGLDNTLVGNDADPALTSALQDQIAVDPNLVNQSNRNAVRPPDAPPQAPYPPARAAGGARQGAAAGGEQQLAGAGCQAPDKFDYNASWANRLPAAFPLYPGGKIGEAAGNNQGACRSRVVTFTTSDAPQRVLDFYKASSTRSGYSAEQSVRGEDQVLGGTNDRDGGAFYLIVTPLPSGGSDAALIANTGR